ncbi:hypothetical protein EGR_02029 [Echinococcus granulosus]|uniref:Expressed conserved protein n=1 Tax=Echinococcus granulosus TaxID=6210 RepID=U6JAA6_ECHGR|nr:hypothetical protein EGR_02029 [Echinococcus granulosus]EUB63225.1 hypothetical protein EGR_02029 [Echinococcus granulosus]CDS18670.1 expressed conserved protein [Echinococcus granulosus]
MEPCKPILENFVSIYETASSSENKKENKTANVYRPPHLNPVFYDGESAGPTKKVSREKRRAAKRLLEDDDIVKEEDLPVEIYYGSSNTDARFLAKMREREKYEEENFTRVSLNKRERLMQKRLERGEFLGTSARIDHIRKLLESSDDEEEMNLINLKKKKKKPRKNKQWKGGKKYRRR